jgi:hypothetical protein
LRFVRAFGIFVKNSFYNFAVVRIYCRFANYAPVLQAERRYPLAFCNEI